MTVQQVIEFLQKLPNKDVAMLLDCPHCGHGQELAKIDEMVVLGGKESSDGN